jgi:hypothetical protein
MSDTNSSTSTEVSSEMEMGMIEDRSVVVENDDDDDGDKRGFCTRVPILVDLVKDRFRSRTIVLTSVFAVFVPFVSFGYSCQTPRTSFFINVCFVLPMLLVGNSPFFPPLVMALCPMAAVGLAVLASITVSRCEHEGAGDYLTSAIQLASVAILLVASLRLCILPHTETRARVRIGPHDLWHSVPVRLMLGMLLSVSMAVGFLAMALVEIPLFIQQLQAMLNEAKQQLRDADDEDDADADTFEANLYSMILPYVIILLWCFMAVTTASCLYSLFWDWITLVRYRQYARHLVMRRFPSWCENRHVPLPSVACCCQVAVVDPHDPDMSDAGMTRHSSASALYFVFTYAFAHVLGIVSFMFLGTLLLFGLALCLALPSIRSVFVGAMTTAGVAKLFNFLLRRFYIDRYVTHAARGIIARRDFAVLELVYGLCVSVLNAMASSVARLLTAMAIVPLFQMAVDKPLYVRGSSWDPAYSSFWSMIKLRFQDEGE